MMDDLTQVQRIIVWILPVVFAITGHEAAHGWMAKKCGDNTAYMLGRLTLNPLKHIDPLGTLILPGLLLLTQTGFVFGWAKPVPVNGRYFKKPLRDMALVAAAGPGANLLMAIAWALLARLGVAIDIETISMPLINTGIAGISINTSLLLINLLPIPPLDGSRIMTAVLPYRVAVQYNQLERYGFIILLALLYAGVLDALLQYPLYIAHNLFFSLAGL
ncbi:MAG: site-2 protease family protein [Methylovulum sp.]|nr:site-2 protease family protein [Methylovulum sp.]